MQQQSYNIALPTPDAFGFAHSIPSADQSSYQLSLKYHLFIIHSTIIMSNHILLGLGPSKNVKKPQEKNPHQIFSLIWLYNVEKVAVILCNGLAESPMHTHLYTQRCSKYVFIVSNDSAAPIALDALDRIKHSEMCKDAYTICCFCLLLICCKTNKKWETMYKGISRCFETLVLADCSS